MTRGLGSEPAFVARGDDRLTAACTIGRGRYSSLGATIFLGIPPPDPRVRTPTPLVPRTSPPGFSEPDDPSWWPKQARNAPKQPKRDNRDANAKEPKKPRGESG
jgi:hypothetical protein